MNNSHEITKKLDDYSKDTDYYFRNYQSDINARLENIKNSISGIDSLMIFIKNILKRIRQIQIFKQKKKSLTE